MSHHESADHSREPALDDAHISDQAPPHWDERASNTPSHTRRRSRSGDVHLLFGSVEDLLADLQQHGAPDDHTVRVERIVRTRAQQLGGTGTLGIAVTARRADEILSCWVVVGRLSLDPWGQPINRPEARAMTERHQAAQHVVAALLADAGFEVRLGLYLLPESAYGFAATCEALEVPTSQRSTGTGDTPPRAPTSPDPEASAAPEGTPDDQTPGGGPHA